MNPHQFADKWRRSILKESAGYVPHFEDVCRLVDHPTPTDADPSGGFFAYQRAAAKESGRQGFADVWFRNHFGWESKSKGDDLEKAYRQLLQYRDNLANPPLLIVCDFERIEVHTNFTGTVSKLYRITLEDLESGAPLAGEKLTAIQVLRACFHDPEQLKPGQTTEALTRDAAVRFGAVADSLRRKWKLDDQHVARYLMRLVFCMFAGDVGLLPKGIIGRLIAANLTTSDQFAGRLGELFRQMQTGGFWGADEIAFFDGGLFADVEAIEIDSDNLAVLRTADDLDWSAIEPSIFGTLFERILDPASRAALGAHYTSRADIELIVEPVVMWPLRRDWEALQREVEPLTRWQHSGGPASAQKRHQLRAVLGHFLDRLGNVTVLDPACGSGNFLYVSLALLKDLEHQVISFGATWGITDLQHRVHPRQLHGIEVNEYAHELASIVVWIGYLQWKHANGIPFATETPILQPLETVTLMDAILDVKTDPARPREPEWPAAEVIVGNPPFLGGKLLRKNLGDAYVDALFATWDGRVRREADFCCYFHEKARAMIAAGRTKRAGLLATQAIRGGANRDTLKRIKETGDIFFAESDREWILDGAEVRIAMVGFDNGSETRRVLDGRPVEGINANLTSQVADITQARRLRENVGICFQGPVKVGAFDVPASTAKQFLASPNPDGRHNGEVVRPWLNGRDIVGRPLNRYIVDFAELPESEAALYERPFEYVLRAVKPSRDANRRGRRRERWWQHGETVPGLRAALRTVNRYVVTPRVARHRVFVWTEAAVLPDSRLYAFAREDDYFFGVLQSRAHEVWSFATASRHSTGPHTYNNTTCFETFPFPRPTPEQESAIGEAAAELNRLRQGWLNPPEGSLAEAELKKRTLTNLYNERPTWLRLAHERLDAAVFAAYGWPAGITDGEILARLLALNLEREAV